MKHLVLVGACYIDTILTVPFYPQEDTKLRATGLSTRRGGNCPNSLEVLAQLVSSQNPFQAAFVPDPAPALPDTPLKLHLVSTLPRRSSPATSFILSSLLPRSNDHENNNDDGGSDDVIDFSSCLFRDDHDQAAASWILRSDETNSRTIVNWNDLPEMTTDEFRGIVEGLKQQTNPAEDSANSEWWFHFEGRIPATTLQCMHYLRNAIPGCKISVEVEKPNREGLRDLASEADVVFYSKVWAESEGYSDPEACLRSEARSSKAVLTVCTWGADGAGSLISGGRYIHCPANRSGEQIKVVDTLGAGDTFIAGMLYALHTSATYDQALTFAVGLATKKVQQEGFAGLVS